MESSSYITSIDQYYAQGRRQVGEFGFYYAGCICRECEELRAKDNTNGSDAPYSFWLGVNV